MKNRQTAEKRQKELRRLERQRDKADRRKLRRHDRSLGSPDEEPANDAGSATLDVEPPEGAPEPLLSTPDPVPAARASAALAETRVEKIGA